jgi:hypothetical protein
MKQHLELEAFADRIHGDRFKKHDFIANTDALEFTRRGELGIKDQHEWYKVNKHCHGQIAARLKIYKRDYDRLLDKHPELLSHLVQGLFNREPERRMVRTLDGTARGFLSDKFRLDMDNYDVANAALPILQEVPDMKILSVGVTDIKMYIKAQFPRLRSAVKVGDEVTAGIVISNSEVGEGSLHIEALIYRLWCTNGMISGSLLKKYHVGAKQGLADSVYEVLTQETRDKTAEAMRAIIKDVTRAATDELKFEERVQSFRNAAEDQMEGDVVKGIEVLGNSLNLNQTEQADVLKQLIRGGDTSRWGLANAVTRAAADVDSYDRATELERMGGTIIDLSPKDWAEVALAA